MVSSAAIQLLEPLRRIVGVDGVLSAHSDLVVYECDGFVIEKNCPDVVVFPKTTAQVAAIVKLCNESGLPFLLFSYAALSITAGMSSIFNAASPLFGAVIAWWWLKDSLTPARIFGLAIGFCGMLWLGWKNVSQGAGFAAGGAGWAVLACVAATLLYGFSASFTKRRLTGVATLAVATGSQLGAALFLLVPAVVWWPAAAPSGAAWLSALTLALACTGLAYLLYFRLIANIGPANAIAVTFLIPAFALLWGWMFLGERVTWVMLLGCAVIVFGTLLATGVWKPGRTP